MDVGGMAQGLGRRFFDHSGRRCAHQFFDLRRNDAVHCPSIGLCCGLLLGDLEGARERKSGWLFGFLVHAASVHVCRDGWFRNGRRNIEVVSSNVFLPLPPSGTSRDVGVALCHPIDGAGH